MKHFTRVFKKMILPLLFGVGCFLAATTASYKVNAQELATLDRQVKRPNSSPDFPDQDLKGMKSLKEVLSELETQYKVSIVGESYLLQDKFVKEDQLNQHDNTDLAYLEELLIHILQPLGLEHKRYGNSFVIQSAHEQKHPINRVEGKRIETQSNGSNTGDQQQIYQLPSLHFLLESVQEKTITGKVIDENGEGLPGVNILVKGTTSGTVTDLEGNYRLSVPDNAETLVFSSVGYLAQEITIGNQTLINITMTPDIKALEEIVVIGYGTQKKSDLTGSISSIKSEELEKLRATDVGNAMQGLSPGVQVTSPTGAPGQEAAIRIRGVGTLGNSNPLYVIDGVPTNAGLNSISSADIASIEILKDASSSAIYGARAANGVVLITTKSGGMESKISLDVSWGWSNPTRLPDMLNTQQFIELQNEAYANDGTPNINTDDPAQLPNTDWLDEIFQTGFSQQYNVGFSGGSEKVRYYISGNIWDEKGTIINSNFNRYSFKANVDGNIKDWLHIGENFTFAKTTTNEIGSSGDGARPGSLPGVVRYAFIRPSAIPLIDERTGLLTDLPPDNLYNDPRLYGDGKNPVAIARYRDNDLDLYRLLGNVFVEATALKDLKIKSTLGLDWNINQKKNFSGQIPGDRTTLSPEQKSASKERHLVSTLNWTNTITYHKNIGEGHDITLLGGTEFVEFFTDFLSASRIGFDTRADFDPDLQYIDFGTGQQFGSGNREEWALFSLFGRASYAYQSKYLASVTVRRDGSSRFGKNNRYGVFPSFSLGWNLADEPFLSDVNWLTELKLRGSWGKLGNQEIGNFPFATIYSTAQGVLEKAKTGNEDVKWETTTQTDIGFDAAMFNGRLLFSFDYYIKKTDDILIQLPVSFTSGSAEPPFVNGASIENKGIDIATTYRGENIGDFNYDITVNISAFDNKVTSLAEARERIINVNDAQVLLKEGEPLSSFFGYKTDGILQNQQDLDTYPNPDAQPGDIRFADINNDGQINDDDRTIIGNPFPDFTYSLISNLSYQSFDLSLFFSGVQGNDIYAEVDHIINSFDARGFNSKVDLFDNRWHGEGTSNNVPRVTAADPNNNRRTSDRFVEDGSFLRLKNVSLGYNLPTEIVNKAGMQSARLYINIQNLFTITNYSGLDPEIYGNENSLNEGDKVIGVDLGTYPKSRIYALGINLNF